MEYPLQGCVDREDAPDRCKAVHSQGQCMQRVTPGSQYCPMHGGNSALIAEKKSALGAYRLGKWQAQVEAHASDSEIKSLRGEIGILRILIQEKMAGCQSNVDLMLQAGPIADLVVKSERLVKTCHDIDKELGQVLDKQRVIQLVDRLLGIIVEEVDDEAKCKAISDRMLKLFVTEQTNP